MAGWWTGPPTCAGSVLKLLIEEVGKCALLALALPGALICALEW